MGRTRVDVPTPALALRRAQAAASVGVSLEVFDRAVRPFVPAVRIGAVTVYPVDGLRRWLDRNVDVVADELGRGG